jgi:hypothetical protein
MEAMRPDLDDAAIRLYLLGLLADEEAQALEEEYLGSPEVLDRVRGVEDDLLDDHAAGRLGPDERMVFERRYLASPRLKERVVAARALRLAMLARARSRARWRGPVAVAAGLLLALLAISFWPSRQSKVVIGPAPAPSTPASAAPSPSSSGALIVSPSSSSPRPGPPVATRVVFALSPVLLRGPQGPPELRVPSGIATVVLELLGDPATRPAGTAGLAVDIERVEGARVWSGRPRGLEDGARPGVLTAAEVPADRLGVGDYILTLFSGDDVLNRYVFRIRATER